MHAMPAPAPAAADELSFAGVGLEAKEKDGDFFSGSGSVARAPALAIQKKKVVALALPAAAAALTEGAAPRRPRTCCRDVAEYRVQGASVGAGMYGEVSRAVGPESEGSPRVALKRMSEGAGVGKEAEGFPITALREIKALRALRGTPAVIVLRDVAEGRPSATKSEQARAEERCREGSGGDLFLVLDFYEGSLHGLLNMPDFGRTVEHVRLYMGQLLLGLAGMHDAGYVHRDIKPANLLMGPGHALVLADFGLANVWRPSAVMTHTVVTLWYRAPELLLGDRNTGPAIDAWAAGVVLLELLTGYPIHRRDEAQRLFAIQDIWALCGCPSAESWPGVAALPGWGIFTPRKRYTRNVRGKFRSR